MHRLEELLKGAGSKFTLRVKNSPFIHRWWSWELTEECKEVAKLSRKAYAQGKKAKKSHPVHKEHWNR